ncbi:carbohydrate sulfotransferase 11 [Athalia rosae]|uniref:carbohydrate sulfotransferase 11 n=1 Tax=Athalia rosae TaxID=37344 RepID=UPI002033243F|nr:carbohydrate sulfotransferase 11 [Athalia rosae]XP_048505627.1 carbohydrate sulfotransferase 11 [Athalia rosae]
MIINNITDVVRFVCFNILCSVVILVVLVNLNPNISVLCLSVGEEEIRPSFMAIGGNEQRTERREIQFKNYSTRYSILGPNALARSAFLERQERLQKNCDAIYQINENNGHKNYAHVSIEPDMFRHFIVDDQHKLLYCYVPKVACTNWKRVLMTAMGKWKGEDPLEIPATLAHSATVFRRLSNLGVDEIFDKLSSYDRLIVVRHPFERLLSAYRNKLEAKHNSSMYFQERFGKKIIKKYRENATQEALEKGDDVTFSEFVDFVTDGEGENGTRNEHWRPITELCHPCVANYNMISKYESLVEDATEVLERIGVPWVRFPSGPQSTQPTSKRLTRYYSTLSFKQLQKLANLYRLDFKIFDYSLEEILGFSIA